MGTAERLVESMEELLWERGYTATSPRAIQAKAGAGQGSMYHHFSGKAQLAVAAEEQMALALKSQIRERLASATTCRDRIAAFFAVDENVLRGCRIGRLVQDPDVVSDDDLRTPITDMFVWIQDQINSVLEDGVAQKELNPNLDLKALAATILAVRQGAYVMARADQSPAPFRMATDGILQLLTPHP